MRFLPLMIGPLMLIVSLIFIIFPPKKINWLYGYRTSRSMKSQAVWDEGNRYSARLMLWISVITTAVQLVCTILLSMKVAIGIAAGVLVTLLLASIPVTENHLKKHFDDEGNPYR
jgi:uncharacterized membrane protein